MGKSEATCTIEYGQHLSVFSVSVFPFFVHLSVSLHFIIYIIMYNHSCSFNEINETNVSMYTADSIVPLRPHPYSVDFHVQFKREPFPHELVMNADSVLVMS